MWGEKVEELPPLWVLWVYYSGYRNLNEFKAANNSVNCKHRINSTITINHNHNQYKIIIIRIWTCGEFYSGRRIDLENFTWQRGYLIYIHHISFPSIQRNLSRFLLFGQLRTSFKICTCRGSGCLVLLWQVCQFINWHCMILLVPFQNTLKML